MVARFMRLRFLCVMTCQNVLMSWLPRAGLLPDCELPIEAVPQSWAPHASCASADGLDSRALGRQLVSRNSGDEIILGREVRIERAVGQAGIRRQRRDPRPVDPVTLEPPAGRLDHPPARLALVIRAVPGHASSSP
jgi:hypothetical protein